MIRLDKDSFLYKVHLKVPSTRLQNWAAIEVYIFLLSKLYILQPGIPRGALYTP